MFSEPESWLFPAVDHAFKRVNRSDIKMIFLMSAIGKDTLLVLISFT